MPSINNIKLTIGGAESPAGTEAAREFVIPVRGVAGLDKTVERAVDPAIVGNNMATGEFLMADDVRGAIPLAIRPCGGIGQLLKSVLGDSETPAQVAACVRIRYTGSEDSCKLVPSASGDTLTSSIGDKGSESGDTNFGTAGVIDLTDTATDTVGELVTVIDAYTDYDCEKIFGADAVDAGEILDFTTPANNRQAKNRWAYVWFGSADSGVYKHELTPDLSSTEHPTYSIQKDGYQDNFLYTGCVVDTLSISAALKAMVEGDCEILGFAEAIGEDASTLTLEDVDPLIFSDGSLTLNANLYSYIRNHSLNIVNNHNADGYGQGSTGRQYHQKGMFEVTGDLQVRLDATSYAERAKILTGTQIGLDFKYLGKIITGSIYEMMIVEIPYASLSTFEFVENTGVFDARISFRAFNPKGTNYNDPLTITLLTQDSAEY